MPDRDWAQEVQRHIGNGHYELDRLWREHGELEAQLAELDRVKWLTAEQEFDRKRLQVSKLAGKDRMIELMRTIRSGAAA